MNHYEGAIRDYDTAIEIKPDFVDAYLNRGDTKLIVGDFDGSIADMTRAIRLAPENGRAYFVRGLAKQGVNDDSAACEDFIQSAELGFAPALAQIQQECRH